MIALCETRDGMSRWIEVDRSMEYGDIIELALVPDLKPDLNQEAQRLAPSFRLCQYEMIERRRDGNGQEYLYYLEIMN